jgi:osmotically-inducible protein OsmY
MFSVQTSSLSSTRISAAGLIAMGVLSGCTAFGGADTQVTAAVRTSLDRHPELGPPNQLQVATLNHVVYLYGSVANDLQLEVAQSVAARASDDAKIVNSIAVTEK